MKESYGEGVAIHTGLEPCAFSRKDRREALVEVGTGRAIEPRKSLCLECRRHVGRRKATSVRSRARDRAGLCVVEDLVHVPKLLTREPGGSVFGLTRWYQVRRANPTGVRP